MGPKPTGGISHRPAPPTSWATQDSNLVSTIGASFTGWCGSPAPPFALKWTARESNPQPPGCRPGALPVRASSPWPRLACGQLIFHRRGGMLHLFRVTRYPGDPYRSRTGDLGRDRAAGTASPPRDHVVEFPPGGSLPNGPSPAAGVLSTTQSRTRESNPAFQHGKLASCRWTSATYSAWPRS